PSFPTRRSSDLFTLLLRQLGALITLRAFVARMPAGNDEIPVRRDLLQESAVSEAVVAAAARSPDEDRQRPARPFGRIVKCVLPHARVGCRNRRPGSAATGCAVDADRHESLVAACALREARP